MKLVDLLVEELSKRGGWPDFIKFIAQDNGASLYCHAVCGYSEMPKRSTSCNIWISNKPCGMPDYSFKASELADDWDCAVVRKEQYESALAAKNDGWINWYGGECPLAKGALIDFRLRGGSIHENLAVGEIIGERWTHSDSNHRASCDIIAYRLHKPEVKAVEWNGEGLPPVGIECVVTPHNSLWGISPVDSYAGKVLAYHGDDFWFVMLGGVKVTSRTDKVDFSLPRTEEERKRELTIRNIATAVSGFMTTEDLVLAGNLYDAIANGKIEGVKLEGN